MLALIEYAIGLFSAAVSLAASCCFLSMGFQILCRALMNQFLSCFLFMPVFCMSMTFSGCVGYGWAKFSGLRSHAVSVATAPTGSFDRSVAFIKYAFA